MARPLLIIVSGAPGTGKTRLGLQLSAKLNVIFMSKDSFKEQLFSTIGTNHDPEARVTLQSESYRQLYSAMDLVGASAQPLIIESNFIDQYDSARIIDFSERYGYDLVQIYCFADVVTAFARFKARALSGERHPGHADHEYIDSFRESLLNGRDYELNLPGKKISLDTNDFSAVDIDQLIDAIGLTPIET